MKVYRLMYSPRWGWIIVGEREPKVDELRTEQGPVREAIRWLEKQP